MDFPYGEWVILFLALATLTEKRAARRLLLLLLFAWLIGKCVEVVFPPTLPWTWHFARLGVMLAFWGWAWRRSERRIVPLLFTTFVLSSEVLFSVNQPGVIPYESWIFTVVLFNVAWLTSKAYWGTAATFIGSILLNQVFMRFTFEGIMSRADFPDPFIWNFGVGVFTVWGGLRLGWVYYTNRKNATQIVEHLLPVNEVRDYESSEEHGHL
jgi:hypothetical protein